MFGFHIVFFLSSFSSCLFDVAPVHFAFVPLGNWAIHLSFLRESSVNLLAQKEDARWKTTDTRHSATFVWLPSPKIQTECRGAPGYFSIRFIVDIEAREKEQGQEQGKKRKREVKLFSQTNSMAGLDFYPCSFVDVRVCIITFLSENKCGLSTTKITQLNGVYARQKGNSSKKKKNKKA